MRILACLDMTEGDRNVIESVRGWATRIPLQVCLLHVMAPEPAFLGYDVPGGPRDRSQVDATLDEQTKVLEEFAVVLRRVGVTVEVLIDQGEVANVIAGAADSRDVDAIVLGARHRSRVQRLLTGSVLQKLLDQSARPVVIAGTERSDRHDANR